MYQNINKIYHAAIYVRLSKEDGDISSSAKLESNSISNQKALILDNDDMTYILSIGFTGGSCNGS